MSRIIEDYCQHKTTGKWITQKYDLENPIDMARYIARKKYAWPGGYQLAIITADGGLICSDCVLEEYPTIHHSTKHEYNDGWQAIGITSEAEMEDDYCSHCNKELGYHDEEAQ